MTWWQPNRNLFKGSVPVKYTINIRNRIHLHINSPTHNLTNFRITYIVAQLVFYVVEHFVISFLFWRAGSYQKHLNYNNNYYIILVFRFWAANQRTYLLVLFSYQKLFRFFHASPFPGSKFRTNGTLRFKITIFTVLCMKN